MHDCVKVGSPELQWQQKNKRREAGEGRVGGLGEAGKPGTWRLLRNRVCSRLQCVWLRGVWRSSVRSLGSPSFLLWKLWLHIFGSCFV